MKCDLDSNLLSDIFASIETHPDGFAVLVTLLENAIPTSTLDIVQQIWKFVEKFVSERVPSSQQQTRLCEQMSRMPVNDLEITKIHLRLLNSMPLPPPDFCVTKDYAVRALTVYKADAEVVQLSYSLLKKVSSAEGLAPEVIGLIAETSLCLPSAYTGQLFLSGLLEDTDRHQKFESGNSILQFLSASPLTPVIYGNVLETVRANARQYDFSKLFPVLLAALQENPHDKRIHTGAAVLLSAVSRDLAGEVRDVVLTEAIKSLKTFKTAESPRNEWLGLISTLFSPSAVTAPLMLPICAGRLPSVAAVEQLAQFLLPYVRSFPSSFALCEETFEQWLSAYKLEGAISESFISLLIALCSAGGAGEWAARLLLAAAPLLPSLHPARQQLARLFVEFTERFGDLFVRELLSLASLFTTLPFLFPNLNAILHLLQRVPDPQTQRLACEHVLTYALSVPQFGEAVSAGLFADAIVFATQHEELRRDVFPALMDVLDQRITDDEFLRVLLAMPVCSADLVATERLLASLASALRGVSWHPQLVLELFARLEMTHELNTPELISAVTDQLLRSADACVVAPKLCDFVETGPGWGADAGVLRFLQNCCGACDDDHLFLRIFFVTKFWEAPPPTLDRVLRVLTARLAAARKRKDIQALVQQHTTLFKAVAPSRFAPELLRADVSEILKKKHLCLHWSRVDFAISTLFILLIQKHAATAQESLRFTREFTRTLRTYSGDKKLQAWSSPLLSHLEKTPIEELATARFSKPVSSVVLGLAAASTNAKVPPLAFRFLLKLFEKSLRPEFAATRGALIGESPHGLVRKAFRVFEQLERSPQTEAALKKITALFLQRNRGDPRVLELLESTLVATRSHALRRLILRLFVVEADAGSDRAPFSEVSLGRIFSLAQADTCRGDILLLVLKFFNALAGAAAHAEALWTLRVVGFCADLVHAAEADQKCVLLSISIIGALSARKEYKRRLLDAGVAGALLERLQAEETSLMAARMIVGCLASLAVETRNKQELVAMGACATLCEVVSRFLEDEEICDNTTRAFRNLSLDPENQPAMVRLGVPAALAALAAAHSARGGINLNIFGTLFNLSLSADANELLFDAELIRRLCASALVLPDDAELFRYATGFLFNLSSSEERRKELVELGAAAVFLRSVEAFPRDETVVVNSAKAIAALSLSEDSRRALFGPEILRLLVKCVSKFAKLPEVSADGFTAFQGFALVKSNQVPLFKHGVWSLVKKIWGIHGAERLVMRPLLGTVWNMLATSRIRNKVADAELVQLLSTTFDKFRGDQQIEEALIGSLMNLSISHGMAEEIVRRGIHAAVLAVLAANAGTLGLQRMGLGFFQNVSLTESVRRDIPSDQIVARVLVACGAFPTDEVVARYGSNVIKNLSLVAPRDADAKLTRMMSQDLISLSSATGPFVMRRSASRILGPPAAPGDAGSSHEDVVLRLIIDVLLKRRDEPSLVAALDTLASLAEVASPGFARHDPAEVVFKVLEAWKDSRAIAHGCLRALSVFSSQARLRPFVLADSGLAHVRALAARSRDPRAKALAADILARLQTARK
eukprot:gnl/Chilomastix_cuspidata/2203.p1 GENE.gnl/Chilomastix_cuspidata/2203~~gnl/Chilomastix_cuspidata/2203.p1  ORF type:complete len:1578 (-),score=470.56 gnl/Chilomastix_cuspidata/2203:852-5540(-)